ncbi:MAG: hypothetical protein ABI724_18235 [Betaproteobacteria bacterium]
MTMLRRVAVALLASMLLHVPSVTASSFTTDQSDSWWIPNESGWGIQFVERGSTIFATLYVYGPDSKATWYTATMFLVGNTLTWSGDLYGTTGPYFAAVPFDPNAVIRTKVGTMTWTALDVATGTLSYDVNGVNVTKSNVTRTFAGFDDFSGHYAGGVHRTVSGCTDQTLNVTKEVPAVIYVNQNGPSIQVLEIDAGGSCTYTGTSSQLGQMGAAQGTFFCSDGLSGGFSFFEMQVTISGLTGRFGKNFNPPATGCQSSGWFGGARGETF